MAAVGALPAVPTALGADDQARQEYFDALNKTLQALEARASGGPNLWRVAGEFLDPGRTGSFGESLGRVAKGVGADIEKQRELEVPLMQMRAQLAGQKYEVSNQAKALDVLSSALGMSPEATQSAVASGSLPMNRMSKITPEVYMTISMLSPKLGEIVKNSVGMSNEMTKILVDIAKGNVDINKLRADYGDEFLDMLPDTVKSILMQNIKKPNGQPSTTTTPVTPSTTTTPTRAPVSKEPIVTPIAPDSVTTEPIVPPPSAVKPTSGAMSYRFEDLTPDQVIKLKQGYAGEGLIPQRGEEIINATNFNALPDSARKTLFEFATGTKAQQPTQVARATQVQPTEQVDDLTGLPLKSRAQIREKRVEAAEKPFIAKQDAILASDPESTTKEIGRAHV